MKELWPLEENKYIFLFYGETVLREKGVEGKGSRGKRE